MVRHVYWEETFCADGATCVLGSLIQVELFRGGKMDRLDGYVLDC